MRVRVLKGFYQGMEGEARELSSDQRDGYDVAVTFDGQDPDELYPLRFKRSELEEL